MVSTITVPAYITSLGFNKWWLSCGCQPSDSVIVYKARGAASYLESKINLANPGTYNAREGVSPSWTSLDGWLFNGINQYLSTGILTTTQTYTMMLSFNFINSNYLAGYYTNMNMTHLSIMPYLDKSYDYKFGRQFNTTPSGISMNTAIIGLNADGLYCNSHMYGFPATPSNFTNNIALYLGVKNYDGGPSGYINAYIYSFALYNKKLTMSQMMDIELNMP